jgi:hypothetical protein
MQTSEAWARLLRGQRNIGDFSRWKEHDSYYQKSFERLMRDGRHWDQTLIVEDQTQSPPHSAQSFSGWDCTKGVAGGAYLLTSLLLLAP